MDFPTIEGELKRLDKMLVTLSQMGIVVLDPPPPASWLQASTEPAPIDAEPAEAIDDGEDRKPKTRRRTSAICEAG